jgi:hypothetical protein
MVVGSWNTRRVNRVMAPCGSISTTACYPAFVAVELAVYRGNTGYEDGTQNLEPQGAVFGT